MAGVCGDGSVVSDSVILLTVAKRVAEKPRGFLERPEDRVDSLLACSSASVGSVVAAP